MPLELVCPRGQRQPYLSYSLVEWVKGTPTRPSPLWVARVSVEQPLIRQSPGLEAGDTGEGPEQGIVGLCL